MARAKKDPYKFLPPYLKWCAENPVIRIPHDEMTTKDRRLEKEYIVKAGEPDQICVNYYESIKGDQDAILKMVENVSKKHSEHLRKNSADERGEDGKKIADIFEMVAKAKRNIG